MPRPAVEDSGSVAERASTLEPRPLPPGTPVGSFILKELLTRDIFGIRYLATPSATPSAGEVVIEEFAPAGISLRDDGGQLQPGSPGNAALWREGLRAFQEESELLARPLHPALIRVAATWQMRGSAYRLWPRLHGRKLIEVCAAMTDAPGETWLRNLIEPLLDALDSLHRNGFLHGNVRPGQILVQPNGVLMLLDTAAVQTAIGARMPNPSVWPEPEFRPPELADQRGIGPWSDLYSLAAVAMFCVNAHRTVADGSASPGDSSQRCPALISALQSALALDPHGRPPSVSAFRRQLQTIANSRHRITPISTANGDTDLSSTRPDGPVGDDFRPPFAVGVHHVPSAAPAAPKAVEHEPAFVPPPAPSEPQFRPPAWPARAPVSRRRPMAVTVMLATAVAVGALWDQLPLASLAGANLTAPARQERSLIREPAAVPALSAPSPAGVITAPERPQAVAPVDPVGTTNLSRQRLAAKAEPPAARSDAVPSSPAQACSPRTNFSLYRCMQSQCKRNVFYAHTQCVRLRRYDELPY